MNLLLTLASLFFLVLAWAIFVVRIPFCIVSNVLLALGAFAVGTGYSCFAGLKSKDAKQ